MNIKQILFGKQLAHIQTAQYQRSTQKWLPIADIQEGVVITKDGRYIKISPSSADCINIMEIRRSTLDVDAEIGRLSDRGDSLLADKIAKLHIYFSLLKPTITDEERHYLDAALVECYANFGIAFDNATLYDEQDLNDFFSLEGGKYGKGIINNSRIKVILPLEEDEALRVKEVLGLSDEETLQVIRNRRGEGLLCAGHNRISVAFQPTQREYDTITTSRADLEAQMRKNEATQP